ncbi:MAG: 2,3-bisphosphoglycerate-independent phosphoglycerate mutase, partial [Erysipelotrichaceae bacterium]|nr:2,3-bisphosphoglycerate-independent phosphoglycerate mutase [Erysipelotrichaceae bacterium]
FDTLQIGAIADIHGRYYVMDRDKNLDRVDLSYRLMVDHDGPSYEDLDAFFPEIYQKLIASGKDPSDEFIIPHYNKKVDGRIKDHDAVIFMNYRPDRAIEISTIITNPHYYETVPVKPNGTYTPSHILNDIEYTCLMKYADSVKGNVAFRLPAIHNTLGPWLANHGYSQLRIAETEKYAHVTFFFDATVNYDGVEKPELKLCRRVLIPSPKVATYDLKPEMSAYLIRDALIKELDKFDLDVVIVNFANCDMVGHTAVRDATIKAVEVVDDCVGSLINWANQNDAIIMVTADHGNAEEILDDQDHPYTAHTTDPVPFCINIKDLKLRKDGKLSNLAPTVIDLLGEKVPEDMSEPSLIIK